MRDISYIVSSCHIELVFLCDVTEEACSADAPGAVGIESRYDGVFVGVVSAFLNALLGLHGIHADCKIIPERFERNYLYLLGEVVLTGNLREDVFHFVVGECYGAVDVEDDDSFRYNIKDILEFVSLVCKFTDGFRELVGHTVKRDSQFSGFTDVVLVGPYLEIATAVLLSYMVNFLQRLCDNFYEDDSRNHHRESCRESGEEQDIDISVDKIIALVNEVVLDSVVKAAVLLERDFPGSGLSSVLLDNRKASAQLTGSLLKDGHKKVEFVSYDTTMQTILEREKGYKDEMVQHGLDNNIRVHKPRYCNYDDIQALILDAISRKVEALVFATYRMALLGRQATLRNSITAPCAFACFNNADTFDIYEKSMYYVKQPIEDFARYSVELLVGELEGAQKEEGGTKIVLPPQIEKTQ